MKIAIIIVKDQNLSKEELAITLAPILNPFNATLAIMEENDFEMVKEQVIPKQKRKSDFQQACEGIIEACGDPFEKEAFRGAFWKAVLVDHAITKPIVDTVAFGPTTTRDAHFVRENHLDFLVEMAKAAQTCQYGKDI